MAQTQAFRPPTTTIYGDQKLFIDSEMADAAEQLMQLSDEDHRSNSISSSNDNNKNSETPSENYLFRGVGSQEEITSRKIEEIFGKDDVEEAERWKPERKRRYRSLAAIYRETSPVVNVRCEKKRVKY